LVTESTGVNINNLTIDGSNNGISSSGCTPLNLVGLLYQNASGTVNHVAAINQALTGNSIGCQVGLAIFVQSGNSGTSNVMISNSHVENYQKNGITGNEIGTTVFVIVTTHCLTGGAAEFLPWRIIYAHIVPHCWPVATIIVLTLDPLSCR
jgi:hypothetical protein